MRRPIGGLARQQSPDGSFGNLRTTALALQVYKLLINIYFKNDKFTIYEFVIGFGRNRK